MGLPQDRSLRGLVLGGVYGYLAGPLKVAVVASS